VVLEAKRRGVSGTGLMARHRVNFSWAGTSGAIGTTNSETGSKLTQLELICVEGDVLVCRDLRNKLIYAKLDQDGRLSEIEQFA